MERMESVIAYIKLNFSTVTVNEISDKFFVSANHLNRIFKKEFSITINQYIILERIHNFERIVTKGECTKKACVRCGFRDYSNFIRTYKKYRGETPGEYIKRRNNKR